MAVRIRLARFGQTKRPFYRIVASESESRRDGKFLEIVGTYNPMSEPAELRLKEDRVKRWVAEGAKPTDTVKHLVQKQVPGLFDDRENAQRAKLQDKRRKRKERAKK